MEEHLPYENTHEKTDIEKETPCEIQGVFSIIVTYWLIIYRLGCWFVVLGMGIN